MPSLLSLARVTLGLSILALPSACGAPPADADVASASARIVGGAADDHDDAVVLITVDNGSQSISCTGTVVSPHVVLTAAHCVDPASVDPQVKPPYTVQIFLGDDIHDPLQANFPSSYAKVARTDFDPAFDPAHFIVDHDVGVVVTQGALDPAPVPMNRGALDDGWVGAPTRIVGFGLSKPKDNGTLERRREASDTIGGVTAGTLTTGDADAHLCFGDSGGPTLIRRGDVESIAGVHSSLDADPCDGAGYDSRVDVTGAAFAQPIIEAEDPGFAPPGDGSDGSDGATGSSGGAADGETSPTTDASSGCSTGPGRSRGADFAGVLALLALAATRRRAT